MLQDYPVTKTVKQITGTKKRSFYFSSYIDEAEHNTASYWDGGSISYYNIYNILTGKMHHAPSGSFPQFIAKYTLQENEILVETGRFRGKDSTPKITCRKSDEEKVRKFLGI